MSSSPTMVQEACMTKYVFINDVPVAIQIPSHEALSTSDVWVLPEQWGLAGDECWAEESRHVPMLLFDQGVLSSLGASGDNHRKTSMAEDAIDVGKNERDRLKKRMRRLRKGKQAPMPLQGNKRTPLNVFRPEGETYRGVEHRKLVVSDALHRLRRQKKGAFQTRHWCLKKSGAEGFISSLRQNTYSMNQDKPLYDYWTARDFSLVPTQQFGRPQDSDPERGAAVLLLPNPHEAQPSGSPGLYGGADWRLCQPIIHARCPESRTGPTTSEKKKTQQFPSNTSLACYLDGWKSSETAQTLGCALFLRENPGKTQEDYELLLLTRNDASLKSSCQTTPFFDGRGIQEGDCIDAHDYPLLVEMLQSFDVLGWTNRLCPASSVTGLETNHNLFFCVPDLETPSWILFTLNSGQSSRDSCCHLLELVTFKKSKVANSFNDEQRTNYCSIFDANWTAGSPPPRRMNNAAFFYREVKLLLCYDATDDGVSMTSGETLLDSILGGMDQPPGVLQSFFVWNCTAFEEARKQLGKVNEHPLLVVVADGQVADTIVCNRLSCVTPIPLLEAKTLGILCRRLSSATKVNSLESDSTESELSLTVNVARLLDVGCRTLRSGKVEYAEKIFVKALTVLDAVYNEAMKKSDSQSVADYLATQAAVLAWGGMSELIQGKGVASSFFLDRLSCTQGLKAFCEEPLSDALRALTLRGLLRALGPPGTWKGENPLCSQKFLFAHLASQPHDTAARRNLIVTLFLAGDLERSITEALKLQSLDDPFGETALTLLCAFCGPQHPLIQAMKDGIKRILTPIFSSLSEASEVLVADTVLNK
eukprot:gene8534-5981_t